MPENMSAVGMDDCRDKILDQDYWDFIVQNYRGDIIFGIEDRTECVQEADFGYRIVYWNVPSREPLSLERYLYNSIPGCYTTLGMEAINAAGIAAVQNLPALQLMGENIMIGFIDTGIDYRNPIFRKLDGSTRIAGIWDQTIQTGPLPEGLFYGSEYTEDRINEALRTENPEELVPSKDMDGHGTYLASVAAGAADVQNQFIGAAPESTIGIVKLKPAKRYLKEFYAIREEAICYQENDIILGLKYLNDLAKKKKMPLVICLALGSNFGGHNGETILSRVLDLYSQLLDRAVVLGVGNEAAERHHYYRSLSRGERVTAEIRVGAENSGFVAEIWTKIPNIVTLSLVSPSGERTRQINTRQGDRYDLVFIFDRTTVTVEYRLILENNDSQLIFLRFKNPSQGIWKIEIEPVQMTGGDCHIWLPVKEFLENDVYFLESDPDTTVTEPGSSKDAMTVAYYDARNNAVDINSGRGYTRNEIIKPDFAAPGVAVSGAGLNGNYVMRSGSSVAVGIAAGAVALMMQWLKELPRMYGVNGIQIKNMIILGANQREQMEYPNREWGYGTLNLYQILNVLREL